MLLLFPVIQRRYDADTGLRRAAGQTLHEGFEGAPLKSPMPYVEVTAETSETSDTFGVDIEFLTVVFTVFTKESWVLKCNIVLENLRRVFHHSKIFDARITVFQFELGSKVQATIEDGVRKASQTYAVGYELVSQLPLVRGT